MLGPDCPAPGVSPPMTAAVVIDDDGSSIRQQGGVGIPVHSGVDGIAVMLTGPVPRVTTVRAEYHPEIVALNGTVETG